MEKLWNEIKEGKLARCYVMFGEETYLKHKYEKRLMEKFSDDISGDMNINIFNGEVDINNIIGAVETLPFFAEKRLVLVIDSKLFKVGKKNDSDRMGDYFASIPESTCLVFIEEEVDKRSKIYKAAAKVGRAIEFKTPGDKELVTWAKKELKKNKVEIDNLTAVYFFRHVGSGMENAASELMKLAGYKGEGTTVTTEDIEEICTKSLEAKVFDVIDAIGQRKTQRAVTIYKGMISAKEPPIKILTLIVRQFRLMLQCKSMEKDGQATAMMAQALGLHDFIVRQCLSQSKNFTLDGLKNAMEECLDADISIKTGKIKDELAVELIIIKYSS